MSSPIGYPDNQAYPNWRGPILSGVSFIVTASDPFTLEEYVTNFASVYFSMNLASGIGVTIDVGFFTDATLSAKAAEWQYVVTNNCQLSVLIPALSNYIRIVISTSQTGNQGGSATLLPLSVQHPLQHYPQPVQPVANSTETVPASTTNGHIIQQVMEGTGYLWIEPLDASGKIQVSIRELNESGNAVNTIWQDTLPAVANQGTTIDFVTGLKPVILQLLNTDAANPHSVAYYARILAA